MKYLLFILLVTSSISYSQDVSEIYKTDTIYFYGYDFAHFTCAENNVSIEPGNFIFPWIGYISDYIPPNIFEKHLRATVIHDFTCTNTINKKIVEDLNIMNNIPKIVESVEKKYLLLYDNPDATSSIINIQYKDRLTEDSIQKIVMNYNLEQKKGIGLVALMEYIDKKSESTLVKFVFFDIKTKIHIKTYAQLGSYGQGIGWTKHWGNSFRGNAIDFLESYSNDLYVNYRKEATRKYKRMRKLK